MENLQEVLSQLRDESTPPGELVRLIDKIQFHYGGIHNIPAFLTATLLTTEPAPKAKEFISADGIAAVVHVAVTGWPADGNLATCQHPYDNVTDVGAAAVQHECKQDAKQASEAEGEQQAGPQWRSPRRRAISCLADLGHCKAYLQEMERVGFFAPDALPAMLESSLAHVDYSLHNRGSRFLHARDQTQAVIVNLLNLAASGILCSSSLLERCREHTGMALCKLYTDPFQLWVDKCHAARQALAARRRAKGWSEERVMDAMRELKQRQQQQEHRMGWAGDCFFEPGGLDYNVVRFFNTLIKGCTDEELLQLIHEGGLITLLKGCMVQCNPFPNRDSPADAIHTLTNLWTRKAAAVSRDLYRHIEEEEAQSLVLRQQGNAAFKAGQHQQALDLYWKAVSHNPQDYAVFNNISLTALKMGDVNQALRAAEESVRVLPTVHKSWVRLGDVFRTLQRWQLANLAYSCARELAPRDAELQARQQEARSHLQKVWAIDDVPKFGHQDSSPDGMGSMIEALSFMGLAEHDPMEVLNFMMGERGEGTPATKLLSKYESTSRYWACSQLKAELDDARAMAVASGLLYASALPASCAGLKRPDQLLQVPEQWSISWTDMPMQHKSSGLVRHVLTVAGGGFGMIKASLMTLGTPGLNSIRRVLLSAMVTPLDQFPCRPVELFVAHRMFPLVDKLSEMCKPWGVKIAAETATEAVQTCKHQDTDPHGYNNRADGYNWEDDDHSLVLGRGGKDPGNGHRL